MLMSEATKVDTFTILQVSVVEWLARLPRDPRPRVQTRPRTVGKAVGPVPYIYGTWNNPTKHD
jgi:hypothetical protein